MYVPQRPFKFPIALNWKPCFCVRSFVSSRPLLPTQGPNVYVSVGTVCSWLTTLTDVTGTVSTCPAPLPPPPSPPPPPYPPGTAVVSNTLALTSALANTAVGRIVLAPGTYYLSAELSIIRSVVLEAAVAGSVVLDAQANSSSLRRVLYINPGSFGVVQLIGLNITGGNVQNVCAEIPHHPIGMPC
jgi:hypothetical protein